MTQTKVAIAWLRKEDWPTWQKIDPDPATYAEWHILRMIQAVVQLNVVCLR